MIALLGGVMKFGNCDEFVKFNVLTSEDIGGLILIKKPVMDCWLLKLLTEYES